VFLPARCDVPGDRRCRPSADHAVWWCDPPTGTPGPPWSTIVFLHGFGEGGDGSLEALAAIPSGGGLPREIEQPDNQLLHDPRLFPFLVVAPQTKGRWEHSSLVSVVRVVERLTASGIVRGRPVLTGFSVGADGAWALASRQPSMFAAIAPFAGEDPPNVEPLARALAGVPVWIGYRSDDEHSLRTRPSRVIRALADAGNREVKVCEYVGELPPKWSGHVYVTRQAYTDSRFYAWLREKT
jgi:predicted peptidase